MNSRKIRFLLWSGCLGGVVLFAGDMFYYGAWGAGRALTDEFWDSIMASVPLWRHHVGSITGPVGIGFGLLGVLGLWSCCRRAAPRLASVMLAFFYVDGLFGILQHGIFGPIGFAIRYCGPKSDAVAQMFKLNALLSKPELVGSAAGSLIWIFLVLRKKAGVPRWTVLICPLLTYWLNSALIYVPAPLGMPLAGGWSNVADTIFFAVLALNYRHKESGSQVPETA